MMHPAQRNKIDISKLTPEERKLLAMYGKLPNKTTIKTLGNMERQRQERKFFDSGDYALSKAGVAPTSTVGTAIPSPENIPHASTPLNGQHNGLSVSPTNSTSPVNKESGLVHDSSESENEENSVDTESGLANDSVPAGEEPQIDKD